MKKVYVNFDEENFITEFSENDTILTEAYMEDDFEFSFGYTKVKEEKGTYYLYNVDIPKEQYISKDNSYEEELIVSIDEYKYKLSETDYIVVKIAEAQVLGEDVAPLLAEYSEEIQNRKIYRQRINELQEELNKINN